ncbi:MAG: hypothetical protein IKP23_04375 [Elusimicrobiaceae bacterium]|nr:hypothetical protein [Elusimicrobiaceae bacterium]
MEKKGLSIIEDVPFDDGGAAEWIKLSNGIEISREHNFTYKEEESLLIGQEYYTVYVPVLQKKFMYNSEGNIINSNIEK